MGLDQIRAAIRDVPDFPKPGIVFKDISPILQSGPLFREVVDTMAARYLEQMVDSVVIVDARGFIFGSALAYKLGCGVSLVRKKGKLPWHTTSVSYDLEYGSGVVEIHTDAIKPGDRVVLVDDLLATGGTACASAQLVHQLQGQIIAAEFVIELGFLKGRERLNGCPVNSLIVYDD